MTVDNYKNNNPAASPLKYATVTVLIRTTNRDSLSSAVESVTKQLYTDWEILIANASGAELTPLAAPLAQQVAQVIDLGRRLGRGEAANALLDAARGKYVIFLDDDDEFLPLHLQKLVQKLEDNPRLSACYADVQTVAGCPGGGSDIVGHVFAREFDFTLLHLQNYLPIHAVLFRLDVVRQSGCRFDETLPLFEDWDFWLKLAAKGEFKRVAGISALYALDPVTGSGHAVVNSQERDTALQLFATRLLSRWNAEGVAKLIAWQAQRGQDFTQAEQQISSLESQVTQASLDITRSALENAALERQHSNAMLHLESSLSEERANSLAQQNEILRLESRLSEERANSLAQQNAILHLESRLSDERANSLAQQNAILHLESRLSDERANSFVQQIELEKLSRIRLENMGHIEALNATLLATYQSTSWRLTKPLRILKRGLAWSASDAPKRLLRNGFLAVKGEIRRHGVAGFVRRLPHFLRHAQTYAGILTSPLPEAKASLFKVDIPVLGNIRLHPELGQVSEVLDASISIVIPTFNAGLEFKWLLRKLNAQKGLKNLEIVVVDSGSTDQTVAWAHEAGCTVVEITQAEFTHSHSRNLGAASATSDYVLFMVQDAYPIGVYWAYGMLRFLMDHADEGLVAASCSEYPRSDSDIMYDSMIDTHYRFLGCHERDRIGDFKGDDHMALRSRGQLSDVACLISRKMFGEYGYQGDYAEDLDLGIRLIKDGHKVAMLASVKVVHSHNRPAFYYLKRSYVDVIFLVGMFKDFTFPPVESVRGLMAGIVSLAKHVSDLLPAVHEAEPGLALNDLLSHWITQCRESSAQLELNEASSLGDPRLDDYVESLRNRLQSAAMNGLERSEARRFSDSFFARLEHFNLFSANVYGAHDALLRAALQDVIRKTFAAAAGSALGFMYMDSEKSAAAEQPTIDAINKELRMGV
jgi:glycosyltransferase involved in cell wall biosynthesis